MGDEEEGGGRREEDERDDEKEMYGVFMEYSWRVTRLLGYSYLIVSCRRAEISGA